MSRCLLDTDILSEILKGRNVAVAAAASRYLARHKRFTLSLITRYEILRGLKAKNAMVQIAAFEERCRKSRVLPLDDRVVVRAADIYADLRRGGALISDADILIAATAIEHRLTLVTANTEHFKRVAGLKLDSWA